ncbi:MAG: hypothetical protein K0Q95_1329 [Bacteroidota bacterium]|jgi:hypothetical protein|nr:hypothetical protein [Bacteroidota bacterium]
MKVFPIFFETIFKSQQQKGDQDKTNYFFLNAFA